MIMYHGTAERFLAPILKEGIKPRGHSGRNNWKHTIGSNPKAVYLTTTYALHFAANACTARGEKRAVLKINTDLLSPFLFAPDEDFLEQVSRSETVTDHMGSECPNSDMLKRTMWYRKRALRDFRHMWETSTEYMGTCCYYGAIPPEAIEQWALVPPGSHLDWASDPTITPINHSVMGAYYRQLMRHVFGEQVDIPDDEFDGDRIRRMTEIPRDGVVVGCVQGGAP